MNQEYFRYYYSPPHPPNTYPRWLWNSLPKSPISSPRRYSSGDWEIMSLQSEGTMTSEDESLEDVVLELMRKKGLLAQIKGQMAKFIQDSGKINNSRAIIPERADEKILSHIYEYLQWIGMKETCSVLLSESPVQVSHSIVKKPGEDYRPKLYLIFDQLPSEQEQNRKPEKLIASIRKHLQRLENKSDNNDINDNLDKAFQPAPPVDDNESTTTTATKRLDDLIDPVKKVSEIQLDFLTSTPVSKQKTPASDATFVKELEKTSDTPSSLLMGFNTPLNTNGFGGQVNRPFVPERLFQDDPFLVKKATDNYESESQMKLSSLTPEPDDKPQPGRDEDHPTQPETPVSKSKEQFLQDEEEMKAFEEEEADLKSTEEDVMERSMSTEWSRDDSRPSSKEKAEDQNEKPQGSKSIWDEVEQNEDENLNVDRSKLYQVSDDFEEDLSSSESNDRKLSPKGSKSERKKADENKSEVLETDKNSVNNNEDPEVFSKSKPHEDSREDEDDNKNGNDKSGGDELGLEKSPLKKSEGDASTSDILSFSLDEEPEEDTQDLSLGSNEQAMLSCEHVVSIK